MITVGCGFAALGSARRADPSLPAAMPLLLEPARAGRASAELDTATWQRCSSEAAALGVLQVHFSGGEPRRGAISSTGRRTPTAIGLYSNLITSGIALDTGDTRRRWPTAGLDHVQLSFQDAEPGSADRIAGLYRGACTRSSIAAALVRAGGLPLTINAVMHRQNLKRLRRHHRTRRGARRRPAGGRACAILRLGVPNRAALLPTWRSSSARLLSSTPPASG